MAERGEMVGLDLETTGLDPLVAEARLLQLAPADGPVVIIDLFRTGGFAPLREPLERLQAVAHAATFDMGFLHRHGARLTLDCTLLANHARTGRREKLATLAEQHLGIVLDKIEQVSDWSGPLSEAQLRYAALDAEAVRRLHDVLQAELVEHGSTRVYELTRGAQPAVIGMSLAGMPFDGMGQGELINRLTAEHDRLAPKLAEALAGRNPSSGPQIVEWLTWLVGGKEGDAYTAWPKTGAGQLSTSADDLKRGAALLPADKARVVRDLLLPYRLVEKQLSTYGTRLADHIHPKTGRIHAKFNLAGTITGRMSSSGPNLQNIPRDPAFRGLFKAPEGRAFVVADYSQMELRVAAILAGEGRLLQAYREGCDTHALTAGMLLGKRPDEVTKAERQLAKAVNFGLLFGQGAKGLQAYAASSYGVEITLQEAGRHREAWHAAYPAFGRWHRATERTAKKTLTVRTPAGRERRWTSAGRNEPGGFKQTEAFNTPVQGGAAEAMLAALGCLMPALDGLEAVPIAVVHDELILEASEADAPEAAHRLEESMVAGMLDVFPTASTNGFVAAHVGTSWADKA
jgi:DNA polymerase-1